VPLLTNGNAVGIWCDDSYASWLWRGMHLTEQCLQEPWRCKLDVPYAIVLQDELQSSFNSTSQLPTLLEHARMTYDVLGVTTPTISPHRRLLRAHSAAPASQACVHRALRTQLLPIKVPDALFFGPFTFRKAFDINVRIELMFTNDNTSRSILLSPQQVRV
jgi:hypothetical protein